MRPNYELWQCTYNYYEVCMFPAAICMSFVHEVCLHKTLLRLHYIYMHTYWRTLAVQVASVHALHMQGENNPYESMQITQYLSFCVYVACSIANDALKTPL